MDLRELVTEPAQAEAVCDRITMAGALSESRKQALHHVAAAKAALGDIELPEHRRRALDLLADGMVERYA